MTEHPASPRRALPGELLTRLVAELDDETVTALILHGSYARGDAVPPYSDVDLVQIVRETPERKQQKRFIWYDSYLLNLSTRPLSIYREWLTCPQFAIYRVQSIRDAQILLDKDGAFHAFQQEVLVHWKWDPLQADANAYASQLMGEQTEIMLKILRALQLHDTVALVDMLVFDLLPTIAEALAVQRGVLIRSGNTYLHQVQEAVGRDSAWTRYYQQTAGIATNAALLLSAEERGRAALRLYQETVWTLQPHLVPEHRKTIEPLMEMIEQALSQSGII